MKFLLLVLTILTATSVNAADLVMPYKGVYDGDTVYSELCFLPSPLKNVSIRLVGIDTPEIRTTCASEKALGYQAKAYLESLLAEQTEILVKNVDWDKYGGRIDGDIILPNGDSVSALMIKSGLARPYMGGTREPWCK